MASVTFTGTPQDNGHSSREIVYSGTLTQTNDRSEGIRANFYTDKTVQILGTFGGATVVVEGSLVEAPSVDADWFIAHGTDAALSFTSADGKLIIDHCKWVRFRIASGASGSTSITAYLLLASSARR